MLHITEINNLKTFFVIFISFFCYDATASIFDIFDSCDEKFQSAWRECDKKSNNCFLGLPSQIKPACEPNDVHLKRYKDGNSGYIKEQNLQQEIEKRWKSENEYKRKSVILGDFKYSPISDGLSFSNATNIAVDITLKNNLNKLLHLVMMSCSITANGAVQLFSGDVYLFPDFISNSQGETRLHFIPPQLYPPKSRFQYSVREPREIAISGREALTYLSVKKLNRAIRSIEISCEINDVNPKSLGVFSIFERTSDA
jgi:hypothetical protein